MCAGFAWTTSYTLTPGQPPPGLDYLPASPHRLPTTSLGQRLHHSPSLRRDQRRLHGLSITWFSTGRFKAGTGISTGCPSTTPVGLALGPDLPWADQLDPGTLSQSAHRVSHVCIATHACILTREPSTTAFRRGFTRHTTLPYPSQQALALICCNDTTSAVRLSPATLSARNHLTSELLRTLSRVAASKPTSWLSLRLHILSHLAYA